MNNKSITANQNASSCLILVSTWWRSSFFLKKTNKTIKTKINEVSSKRYALQELQELQECKPMNLQIVLIIGFNSSFITILVIGCPVCKSQSLI